MTNGEFQSQLEYFKTSLMSLYRQKTKLVAVRESLRFTYVTSLKTTLDSVISAMAQDGYNAQNSGGVTLLLAFTSMVKTFIPMTNLKGDILQGWGGNPQNPGNAGAGFLSPIENLLTIPFDPDNSGNPGDTRPAYKYYGINFWIGSNSPEDIVNIYFIPTGLFYEYTFSIPPSEDWTKKFLAWVNANFDTSYPFMKAELSKKFAIGSFGSVVEQLRAQLLEIVKRTQYILRLQEQIDQAQDNLSEFVLAYKDYSNGLDVAKLFLELQAAAEKADTAPPTTEGDVAPVVLAQKSKWPWLIAAGVIGALTLGDKGK